MCVQKWQSGRAVHCAEKPNASNWVWQRDNELETESPPFSSWSPLHIYPPVLLLLATFTAAKLPALSLGQRFFLNSINCKISSSQPKTFGPFSKKTLWNEGGRQGQMEYLNLISDFQFFISLILMYVIEHCHTINQHPNIPQKYLTNAFEKIKSDSKHLQTLHFNVWDLDNFSKCE